MPKGRACRRPDSPETPRECDDATLASQLQQFLDEWYYRILHSTAAKGMNRREALRILLDALEMVGVQLRHGEKDRIIELDEEGVISRIVACMPTGLRKQWAHVSLELQQVIHSTSAVRQATEIKGQNADETVAGVFEDGEGTEDGVLQQILKSAVVLSAEKVTALRKIHVSWRKSTDARINRMAGLLEDAQKYEQELLALEAQLMSIGSSQKDKSKSMLLKLANGQDSALKHCVLSTWHGLMLKMQAESVVRRRFEDQITVAEKKYFEYKAKQVQNVRSIMARMCYEEDEMILREALGFWATEVKNMKAEGDTSNELKEVQARLANFEKQAKDNAKMVMTRLAGNNAGVLLSLHFQGWLDYLRASRQEKELEDAVKKTEAALKKHLASKKDEARQVMERLTGSCDSGLLALMMQHWVEFVHEEKNERAIHEAKHGQERKFKLLCKHQRSRATNVQNRVNQQLNLNLLQKVLSMWVLETKVNSINHICTTKYTTKKKQLQGVQNLFQSFAVQLEQNLGADDSTGFSGGVPASSGQSSKRSGESSKRGTNRHREQYQHREQSQHREQYQQREHYQHREHHHRGMVRDSAGSVSLPNINERPYDSIHERALLV